MYFLHVFLQSKKMPKLVKVEPLTVSCDNEFSGLSDSDELPPLQSDEEGEEEDQAKMKYKVCSTFQLLFYP